MCILPANVYVTSWPCDVSLSPDCAVPNVMWTGTDLWDSRHATSVSPAPKLPLILHLSSFDGFHDRDHVVHQHNMNLHKMNLVYIAKLDKRVDLQGGASTHKSGTAQTGLDWVSGPVWEFSLHPCHMVRLSFWVLYVHRSDAVFYCRALSLCVPGAPR